MKGHQHFQAFDRLVFIGSIIGLVFLISTSLFRYYVLLPRQENLRIYTDKIERLQAEVHRLRIQNEQLRDGK